MATSVLAGTWPAPAVVFVGPSGSGTTTLVEAIAERLQLDGTVCVAADAVHGLDPPPGGVAVVDGIGLVPAARAVLGLVRAGWRVLAAVDGPGIAVDEAFAPLVRSGHATLVELPALERLVREAVVRQALPDADPSVVEQLGRAGPGDGSTLAVLAARTVARAALARAEVDASAAAAALRAGRGTRTCALPVPTHIERLLTVTRDAVPRQLVAHVASSLRPLLALGPLAQPIAEVAAGAPLAMAGGERVQVATRVALHHALEGRSVLVLTARQREADVVSALVDLAGGTLRDPGVAASLVAGLPIAVLADPARSLADVAAAVHRCRSFVGFAPDIVVVDVHSLDDIDHVVSLEVPVVVAGNRGSVLPARGWAVDDRGDRVALRPAGGAWRPVARSDASTATGAPDGLVTDDTGAVRAWRLWSLVIDADGVALASPVRTDVWPRGVITSTCLRCGSKPQATCSCGIYAFRDARLALAAWRSSPHLVFGELRCWGRVLRHDNGVRAEHAQPVTLHLGTIGSETERRSLSARYGCDVTGR